MNYLCYLCFLGIVVSNTSCVVFLLCFSSSCVPYVVSFSRLSIFDCPFSILLHLFRLKMSSTTTISLQR
jgi:hypothetical protein